MTQAVTRPDFSTAALRARYLLFMRSTKFDPMFYLRCQVFQSHVGFIRITEPLGKLKELMGIEHEDGNPQDHALIGF